MKINQGGFKVLTEYKITVIVNNTLKDDLFTTDTLVLTTGYGDLNEG